MDGIKAISVHTSCSEWGRNNTFCVCPTASDAAEKREKRSLAWNTLIRCPCYGRRVVGYTRSWAGVDLRTCASVPCFLNLRAAIHNILKLATHSCSKKDSRKVSPWKNIRIISPKHKKIPPGSSRERVECIFRMCTSSRCSCLWRIHCSRFAAKTISSAHLVFFSCVSHLARKFHQIDSRYALLWCDNLSA